MCLIINTNVHKTERSNTTLFGGKPKPFTANKDITVYKIVLISNKSIWFDFSYEPNQHYKLNEDLFVFEDMPKEFSIYKGFHGYTTKKRVTQEFKNLSYSDAYKIVEFVIPKGAKFFKGKRRDIVSNEIRAGDLKACA